MQGVDVTNAGLTPASLARVASGGKWQLRPHLAMLNRKLMEAAAGNKRLMVFMPPRHGKSEMCSRYFPAWYVGTFPDRHVMLCSYESTFASTWGQRARDVLEQCGRNVFGVEVRDDARNRRLWETQYGGGMITAGVGGPITGRGANIAVIDDPVKNAEEAMSPKMRQRNLDWYLSTLYTRLEPDASIVLLMTRWHEGDLAGLLLKEMEEEGGEKWEVLSLPALAEEDDALGREPGMALWPDRYNVERLGQIRRAIQTRFGDRWWHALYQQRPSAPEGGMFRRFWFKSNPIVPKITRAVRYWDLAATEDEAGGDPDWTVGTQMGESEKGQDDVWVLDQVRLRGTPREVEDAVKRTAELDGRQVPIDIEQEPGAASKALIDYYKRVVLKGYTVRAVKSSMSKLRRAEPLSSAMELGRVTMARAPWNAQFVDECVSFPYGEHDDQVDSASGAYSSLVRTNGAWDHDELSRLSGGVRL